MGSATHEVAVSCPICGQEIDVAVTVSGRHIRATRTDPAEYPEIDVTEIACDGGCRLSEAQEKDMRDAAIEKFNESFEGAEGWCGEYDTTEERDRDREDIDY